MQAQVDGFRKVTVSLAGRCPLACRHCYTMTKQFSHDPPSTPEHVVRRLAAIDQPFDVVCISGDTDCFLDEADGLRLIASVAESFPQADVMFTTRLVPSPGVIDALIGIGAQMAARRQLLLPGVSFVSMRVPNFSERSRRIPTAERRFDLLAAFTSGGLPCLMALRPTFPFSLAPREDVTALVRRGASCAAVILGEILILDAGGQIAERLHVPPAVPSDRTSPLTFLDQPGAWRKRTLTDEVRFTFQQCRDAGRPYFLRSGQALAYLRAHWDWVRRCLPANAPLPGIDVIEAPDP